MSKSNWIPLEAFSESECGPRPRVFTLLAAFIMIAFAVTLSMLLPAAYAQTSVTGSLNGAVTDSQGAVVANASVTVMNTATGDTRVLTTNQNGRYVAPYLTPGDYNVSASSTSMGLQSNSVSTRIMLGQQAVVNVELTPVGNKQTVVVSGNDAQLINTQSANLTTTFSTKQFENLPDPGGDITAIAFTVPGVVMGTGPGYGNFSSDGLPSISNLLVINGMDYNDPFLNQNATGASILSVGQYEIAQSAIVQNGYTPQYGRQAGVIETYTTKSGSNNIHGLAFYSYNSAGLNANSFLNDMTGAPKTKAVSNQYAAQIGGPIIKNKLFGFVDNEGIRFILPANGIVNFPSADMQNTVLHTVPSQSEPIYATMFDTLDTAPTYSSALPIVNGSGALEDGSGTMGCGSYAGTPVYGKSDTYFGVLPAGVRTGTVIPCMTTAIANASNLNREWFLATRVDYNVSDNNKLFGRFTDDQGKQPAYTSFINPVLNQQSIQPEYSGQLNDTEIFTPNLTNQFIMSGLYISETFGPANIQQTLQASPTLFLEFADGGSNSQAGVGQAGNLGFGWSYNPQGRRDTQYQFVDDLSWLKGKHSLKFGINFKRDDVTDIGLQENTYGGYYYFNGMADFGSGVLPGRFSSNYNLNFARVPAAYDALYNYGIYAQDEWQATPNLVVDYGVRVDRNGNPLCNNNCFTRYIGGNFPQSGVTANTPYNASIAINNAHAFPAVQTAVVQPRAGFAWDTRGNGRTVVRGGAGLFADEIPAIIISNEYETFPETFAPSIFAGSVGQQAGSAMAYAEAGNAALNSGFSSGQSFNQISAALAAQNIPFYPPSFYVTPHTFYSPEYAEWSLQVERQLDQTDAVIASYVGNHGFNLLMPNTHLNQSTAGSLYGIAGSSFQDLPSVTPDVRFAQVGNFSNGAISNYNGFMAEYKHIDRRGLTADISYTWSHALDDISNGGAGLPFNGAAVVTSQIVPGSISKLMYSNSDNDIRNSFLADVVYVEPYRFHNKLVELGAGGWTIAAKAYWRSGLPFTVVNENSENALSNGTGGTLVLAQVLNNNFNHTCLSYSHPCFQTPGIFNGQGYASDATGKIVPYGPGPYPQTIFGNVPKNSYYGPHFANVDLSLYKDIMKIHSVRFQLGAQAYNALNHVNFGAPGNNASFPSELGVISPGNTLATPTSPYGKYGGTGSRVLVVQGRLIF